MTNEPLGELPPHLLNRDDEPSGRRAWLRWFTQRLARRGVKSVSVADHHRAVEIADAPADGGQPTASEDEMRHAKFAVLTENLRTTLNRSSAENGSDTPDFLLARFLAMTLQAFDDAVRRREEWVFRDPKASTAVPAVQSSTPPFESEAAIVDGSGNVLCALSPSVMAGGLANERRVEHVLRALGTGVRLRVTVQRLADGKKASYPMPELPEPTTATGKEMVDQQSEWIATAHRLLQDASAMLFAPNTTPAQRARWRVEHDRLCKFVPCSIDMLSRSAAVQVINNVTGKLEPAVVIERDNDKRGVLPMATDRGILVVGAIAGGAHPETVDPDFPGVLTLAFTPHGGNTRTLTYRPSSSDGPSSHVVLTVTHGGIGYPGLHQVIELLNAKGAAPSIVATVDNYDAAVALCEKKRREWARFWVVRHTPNGMTVEARPKE